MATYYVSPSGSAAWGSATNIATPCSLTTAMTNAAAGDIVYCRGGTYNLGTIPPSLSIAGSIAVKPTNSGTSGNPITFIAYTGETPTLTATVDASSQSAWIGADTNYIVYDGFAATMIISQGSYESAIFGLYGDNCTVKNCDFTGIDVNGDSQNHSFVRVENGNDNIVTNNDFHDLYSSTGIVPNTAGVWLFDGDRTLVYNNSFRNMNAGCKGKTGVNSASFYRNFVYNTTNNRCQDGFYIGYQGGGTTGVFDIHHNVFVGCQSGVRFAAISGVIAGLNIYNNTIVQGGQTSGAQGIFMIKDTGNASADPCFTTADIYNNIIAYTSRMADYPLSAQITFGTQNYNWFYSSSGTATWRTNEGVDGGSSTTSLATWRTFYTPNVDANSTNGTDPSFVNGSGSTPASYRADAAGVQTASDTGGVVGAYEGSPTIGYVPATSGAMAFFLR